MEYCKDCKHGEEDTDIFTPQGVVLGMLLLHIPLSNMNCGRLKCKNDNSPYYLNYVDDNDNCSKFEKK